MATTSFPTWDPGQKEREIGFDSCNASKPQQTIAAPTVGEHLDRCIKVSRLRTEQLCIIKAKAEASGLLEFSREFISDILHA